MKNTKKKIIIACVSVLAVLFVAVIAGAVYFRANYVLLEGKYYKKDIDVLPILNMNYVNINELNMCTELETVDLYASDNSTFENLRAFEKLTELNISHPQSQLNGPAMEKINMFPNLKRIYSWSSDFDFTGINSESLERITINFGDITDANLNEINNCPSLTELYLNLVALDNCLIVEVDEETSEKMCTMTDSSFLSDLDNIKRLVLMNIFVEDISGIGEMDSLETFIVDEGCISKKDKWTLANKGISVLEETY